MQNMFDILSEKIELSSVSFLKGGLGIVINISQLLQPFIYNIQSPYLLEDYRLGYIKKGYLHGIINLQEYTIKAGNAIFITPGTIVEPQDASSDLTIVGMGVQSDLFHIAHSGRLPSLFNNVTQKHGILTITKQEGAVIEQLLRMLSEIATTQGNAQNEKIKENSTISEEYMPTVHHLIAAITYYYNNLFEKRKDVTISPNTTGKDTFDRFIQQVNLHCREQRQIAFYADKLCLTERYLGTVIRQTSGITAKEWIDRAVITAAKVMLRHENFQIAEISERLHFATPSFFCKYFKRLTGCTPQEYRQG